MKRKRNAPAETPDSISKQKAVLPVDPDSEAGQYLIHVQKEAEGTPAFAFVDYERPVAESDPITNETHTKLSLGWEQTWLARLVNVEETDAATSAQTRSKAGWKEYLAHNRPTRKRLQRISMELRFRLLWYFRTWMSPCTSTNELKWVIALIPVDQDIDQSDLGTLRILGQRCKHLSLELPVSSHSEDTTHTMSCKANDECMDAPDQAGESSEDASDGEIAPGNIFNSNLSLRETCNLVCSILAIKYRQLDFAHEYI